MSRAFARVLLVLAAGTMLAACGEGDSSTEGAPDSGTAEGEETAGQQGFDARLEPLNGSGVRGRANLSQLGSTLRVQSTLAGLEPREEHVQHVHRLEGGAAGECPPEGGGMVSLDEATEAYGPVALKLDPFPRASGGGDISFQGTFEMPPELEPLTDRVIAIYGMDVDGVYDPTVPVACGRIG